MVGPHPNWADAEKKMISALALNLRCMSRDTFCYVVRVMDAIRTRETEEEQREAERILFGLMYPIAVRGVDVARDNAERFLGRSPSEITGCNPYA